ncbi:gem-associated protein 7-like [Huso huso]|uniref:Gem-associated protein 7-like n=1 Tax=Huso huso TaxID=61971 RepID=A0ABR0ZSE7_HUSHU
MAPKSINKIRTAELINVQICVPLCPVKALCPSTISASCPADSVDLRSEQRARLVLRERYLRNLIAMVKRDVKFTMYEKVKVDAVFAGSDIDILNFQVTDLKTLLGMQKEALIRCPDVISYSFELDFSL